MSVGKAVIGQSGGPSAVINRSLVGFIKESLNQNFDEILGAKHGLEGMLSEDFVDLSIVSIKESPVIELGFGRWSSSNNVGAISANPPPSLSLIEFPCPETFLFSPSIRITGTGLVV